MSFMSKALIVETASSALYCCNYYLVCPLLLANWGNMTFAVSRRKFVTRQRGEICDVTG